jgi:hypothetical protein
MLKGLFKVIAFLAVILIAVESAWTLWIRLDPNYALSSLGLSPSDFPGVIVGNNGAARQFETTEPSSVKSFSSRVADAETGRLVERRSYTIIPIYVQNIGKDLPEDTSSSLTSRIAERLRQKRRTNGLFPRPCPLKYGSGILVRFHQTNETMSVFEGAKIAIIQYDTEMPYDGRAGYIVIRYVKADSDGDGELTCNDHRSLAVYDIVDRRLIEFDLDGGEPIPLKDGYYRSTPFLGVGVDENGDGWHDRTRERVRIARFDHESKSLEYLTP